MKNIVIFIIKLYRCIFAPYRNVPRCKYFPSCSEYALLAIERHGLLRGLGKACWRLIRCNPFSRGGLDLP